MMEAGVEEHHMDAGIGGSPTLPPQSNGYEAVPGSPRRSHQQEEASQLHAPSRHHLSAKQCLTLQQGQGHMLAGQATAPKLTFNDRQVHTGATSYVHEVRIAIIGTNAVGKSTFVSLALDLKTNVKSSITRKKVSLEGSISTVSMVELNARDLGIASEHLVWPSALENGTSNKIDGVIVLYNVLDPDSISPLPTLLDLLSKESIPAILVATNCDAPPRSWRIDYGLVEHLCGRFKSIECFQTSLLVPATHKRCVSIILRDVMLNRHGIRIQAHAPCKFRGQQFAVDDGPAHQGAIPSFPSDSATSLAIKANSKSDGGAILCRSGKQDEAASTQLHHHSELCTHACNFQTQDSPGGGPCKDTSANQNLRFSCSGSACSHDTTDLAYKTHSADGANANLALAEDFIKETSIPSILEDSFSDADEQERGVVGTTTGASFDDLVDRLLSRPMSKSDSRFATIFLCFYRRFAAPFDLFSSIVQRFEDLTIADIPNLVRFSAQLRHLTILQEWIADFPGDFAHPRTYRAASDFVQAIAGHKIFAAAYKEIATLLESVCEDDDTHWACSDTNRSRASTRESLMTISSVHSALSSITADSSMEEVVEQQPILENTSRQPSTRASPTPSIASSVENPLSQSHSQLRLSAQNVESAQLRAQLLHTTPKIVLDKIRWHQVMDINEDCIARELTRIDWILYSSIRPRDLVRHISLSGDEKEGCKGLEHVNRMIDHFNHTAFWVANWILLRDKPKHRAKALEKFMGVAWKLRHLNNYNSLGAVIAGINGTAVHRLSQTRDLVSQDAQKQFMRLEILMGTQKSHFAYRLAWENTSTARIPFLPLHRRDLVVAEEANHTIIASNGRDLINWKKFEVMGQAIIEIRNSQQMTYQPFESDEDLQRLLLEGIFSKEDDELYERSVQVEKPRAGEHFRKKLTWFQRY